ncbi:MAG TPA: M56 family metallopeptidase, partial [Thermoanaerobaculia bacterium]
QAVAWALVHFLWQGTLVGLGLAAALALGRGWSARLRYALSAGALLLMLALPVATAVARLELPAPAKPFSSGLAAISTTSATAPGTVPETGVPAALAPAAGGTNLEAWLPAVLSLWVVGVVLLSVYHLGGWLQARRLAWRDARPAAAEWTARLGALRDRLGIGRPVALLESARVAVPAVVGWLKPVILVPASAFAGLAPQQLEAILAHELAHVRRHDYLINLLQTAVETLLFYHPAVWWASRQVRIERESCCDDLALAVYGDRVGYARALATLEGLRAPAPRLAMAATGGTGSLLARIRRIVGAPAPAADRSSAWLTGSVAVLTLLACLAVQQRPTAAAQPAPPAPPASPAAQMARLASPAPPAPLPPTAPAAPAPPAPKLSGIAATQGTWTAERKQNGVQLEMEMHSDGPHGHHDMQESNLYQEKDLIGLTAGPAVRFEIRRAAGTFHFEGRFEGAKGSGMFNFKGNPAYVSEMASLGYDVKNENLMQLALFDVSPAFVRELGNLGYSKVPLERLVQFRIHEVNPDFIRGLNDVGYRNVPAERLVQFRIHGVKPELIRSLKELGMGSPDPEDLIKLQIHGATPDFIRAMAAA